MNKRTRRNLMVEEQHQLLRKVRWFSVFGAATFIGAVFLFGWLGLLGWGAAVLFLWYRSNKRYGN